ncbi:MAG TPA: tetratricopeptide repeat protein, partial [Gammaproteobacteria bacterium]|nr:tetratricopeptide repeat protein [Gammaproteobacteria bacterium]
NIWLKKTPSVSRQQRLLIASANYFAKYYTAAENHIDALFTNLESLQKSTYELGLAIYVENKKYQKAIDLLQRALAQYPNDENFWRHLAGLYRQAHQESLAVASLQSAYEVNLLKDDEIVNLAKMLFYLDAPFPAARLLQDAMQNFRLKANAENLKLLAECWLAAREYQFAIDSFAEAARVAKDGDLYLRQAEILIDQERWNESVSALQKAFSTERISKKGKAQLLLGIANYEAGNLIAARAAFDQARHSKKHKKNAGQWLSLIKSRI